MDRSRPDITALLERAGRDDEARARLMSLVYDDLRAEAARRLARGPAGAPLNTTDLVSEAYLRIFGSDTQFENRRHFYFAASRAMRDVIVEHVRRALTRKRGGDWRRQGFDADALPASSLPEHILNVREALDELEREAPDRAAVVLMRFFGGLTYEQIAGATGRTSWAVRVEWAAARTWLEGRLRAPGPGNFSKNGQIPLTDRSG